MKTLDYRALVNDAHAAVTTALAKGHLKKQPCEVCGEPKVEAHHEDYRLPLFVRWLCRKDHKREHTGKSHKYQFLGLESCEPQGAI